jgi:hypothetical protein
MEMLMDANSIWSAALSVLLAGLWFFIREKFDELKRLDILLNKTREDNHRDFVTKSEVQRITDHIDQRFNKLEEKLDKLLQVKG